ncbi:hypothetical protein [Altibacter sp. HG106]|uniref:hypothetical protein n=1 Tax=Altibacter sp. HG106 TaxID=3023937 RepID=UPI00234FE295|nr:hypothetical protein [Altibacter sp. HG106]MDC7994574.1 hypothetical protein [Altibacter sp. HG106]
MKTYTTPFGTMQCFENYLVFHLEAENISRNEAKEIVSIAEGHFQKRKFVFISNRTLPSVISEEAYKEINLKYMVGIAIVSKNENTRTSAMTEQSWFDGSFSYFATVEEAVDWANTVVKQS